MHFKLLLSLTLVSFVRSNDVSIGTGEGRKIFEDTRSASPAIWRQIENVTVIAPNNEVIGKVNVTDLRPDKDGDVKIVDGGEGENSVTMELKSPTILRGYEFHIEVYSMPAEPQNDDAQTTPEVVLSKEFKTTADPEKSDSDSEVIPVAVGKDSDISRPARETNDAQVESETEVVNDETTTELLATTETENDSTTEQNEGSGEETTPSDSDVMRPARQASEENPEDIETTTELMDDFEIIGTFDYISTTEETGTEKIPELIAEDELIRPARESNEENQSTITTEDTNKDQTTELSTKDIVIDKSHYSDLVILEYIKKREQGARQSRRTDEEESSKSESHEDSSEIPSNDETSDLVPPAVDAQYSDNFSAKTTEAPIEQMETTLSVNIRPVRRYELPDEYYTTSDTAETTTDEVTEESTLTESSTTESLEGKPRNSRNTEDLENSGDFDLNKETSDANVISNDKFSSGIVLLNGNEVIVTADGKEMRFSLPIVLIIGNENNFPLFNFIGNQDVEKKVLNMESESNLDENFDDNGSEYTSLDAQAAAEVLMNDESY